MIMVLLLLCSCSVCAFAEAKTATAEEIKEYSWDEVEEAILESGVEGRFVGFDEVGLTFWLPDIYEDFLEEEDREEGYIGYFMTEDGEAFVSVTYEPTDYEDLEVYKDVLLEEGIDDAELVSINGLDAVEFTILNEEETDEVVLFWFMDFLTDSGNMVEMVIYPVTEDEDIQALTAAIISSVMPEAMLEDLDITLE